MVSTPLRPDDLAAMVEDGLMERFGIDEVYGMHNWPGIEAGKFAIRTGAFFAATDIFDIEIEGKGSSTAPPATNSGPPTPR